MLRMKSIELDQGLKGRLWDSSLFEKRACPLPSSTENLGAGHLVTLSHCHSQEMGLLKKKKTKNKRTHHRANPG